MHHIVQCLMMNELQIISLNLPRQMVKGTPKKRNIDRTKHIIDRHHQQRIPRKKEPRRRQGRILRQRHQLRGAIQIHKTSPANQPLTHRRPKMHRERTRGGSRQIAYRSEIRRDYLALDKGAEGQTTRGTSTHGPRFSEYLLHFLRLSSLGFILQRTPHLIGLRGDVSGMTGGEEDIARLHDPRPAGKEGGVHEEDTGHVHGDYFWAGLEGVVDGGS
mmetsp:Transcript_2037/g.2561  ORF Transcript_2037/g.2561 Transcript_2037/m.2561 type:complete len:217 (+) Transcript_2037:100-750(+)